MGLEVYVTCASQKLGKQGARIDSQGRGPAAAAARRARWQAQAAAREGGGTASRPNGRRGAWAKTIFKPKAVRHLKRRGAGGSGGSGCGDARRAGAGGRHKTAGRRRGSAEAA